MLWSYSNHLREVLPGNSWQYNVDSLLGTGGLHACCMSVKCLGNNRCATKSNTHICIILHSKVYDRLYSTFATSGPQLTALLFWGLPPQPPPPTPYNTVHITHNWMQQWHIVTFIITDFTYSTINTSLVWSRWIHSTPREPISRRYILTLSSHLILSFQMISFLELSSPKLDMYFLTLHACYMSHSSWFYHVKHTNYM